MKKEVMNMKKSRDQYKGMFGGRTVRELQLNYKLKNEQTKIMIKNLKLSMIVCTYNPSTQSLNQDNCHLSHILEYVRLSIKEKSYAFSFT